MVCSGVVRRLVCNGRRIEESTRCSATLAFIASVSLVLTACGPASEQELPDGPEDDDVELGQLEAAIHGGTIITSDSAFSPVIKINAGLGNCSAVKIGPTRWLTAAHCLSDTTTSMDIRTTANGLDGGAITVTQVRRHPSFKLRSQFAAQGFDYDLAIFDTTQTTVNNATAGLPGLTPVADNATGVGVGYGENDLNSSAQGKRQMANINVSSNVGLVSHTYNFVGRGTTTNNVQMGRGDSGGAFFASATNLTVRGIFSTGAPLVFNQTTPSNNQSRFVRVGNVLNWLADPKLEGDASMLVNQSQIKLMNIKQASSTTPPNTLCLSARGRNVNTDIILDECDSPTGELTGNPPGWGLSSISGSSAFTLRSAFTAQCLSVPSTFANNSPLTIAPCGAANTSQSWRFQTVAGVRSIRTPGTPGLCIGTNGGSVSPFTTVVLRTCNDSLAGSDTAWLWIK